ncbi:aminoglycoside 3'-phosphotransferase [Undibacterium sp. CY18W]|uniref:Aminoglycoside 3'-phosphotransferase n=1 Tax=Undibacterium hunanense TaxID=2762292 RepID=A0ABR6ZRW6_9BURK|nr:APH(3') family aminoglycoside O-phosphotransferase [Undibacterium hunanense]MBC3918602.1 aminoglycoside 3'-phosphotransferase [Undibacterium hunanense]
MPLNMPSVILRFIDGALLKRDKVGESPCKVYSFYRGDTLFYLKSSPVVYASTTYSVMREAAVLQWLAGKLSVPEVMAIAEHEEHEYMITRSVPGRPLSSLIHEGRALDLFRDALHQIQSVSIDACPFDVSAAARLRELDYLLSHGLAADEYDLQQWPDLVTPDDLRLRLQASIPAEDFVFSHGDLGDSNVFVDASDALYFIDLGRGGKADSWLDIAFVHRNLREDVSDDTAAQFLDGLGRPDSPAKREFYEQLDELF